MGGVNECLASHTLSLTLPIKDPANAGNIFSFVTWVDGKNCDLPYIRATNLIALPDGSVFRTYLTTVSSSSGYVDASVKGNTATSIRTQARMGGPYAGIKFNYAIELKTPTRNYVWEFLGWDGSAWEGCNYHVPMQVSFKDIK